MADIKYFLDAQGGQEIVNQLKTLIDAKASPEAVAQLLTEYSKTTEIQSLISTAIAASEKKIFGDGELADAFDTIKEIGDYLKDHDEVAEAINQTINGFKEEMQGEIDDIKSALGIDGDSPEEGESILDQLGKKLDASVYNSEKTSFETTQNAADTYQTKEGMSEYVKTAEIQPIPTGTIQSWFN